VIKLAVDMLDGTMAPPADKTILFNSPGLTIDTIDAKYTPETTVKIELGKTVFPDLAPGLSLPISPFWADISAKETSGT